MGLYQFTVNGAACSTDEKKPLLRYLRDDLQLYSVKDGCSEGVCGTCTDWCVDSTIRDAYHRDYNVVALADGISTYPHAGADPDTWNRMEFDLWGEAFARVMKADEAKEEIRRALAEKA